MNASGRCGMHIWPGLGPAAASGSRGGPKPHAAAGVADQEARPVGRHKKVREKKNGRCFSSHVFFLLH